MRKRSVFTPETIARFFILSVLLTCFALSACSFSHSSKAFSNSSTSPSKSSSGDDGEKEYKQTYINEIMIYTDGIVNTHATPDDYMRGLARIAERNGISNWEANHDTYIGIGKGLRMAGLAKKKLYTLPILASVMTPRPKMMKYIIQGYDS
ncbi:MAG: putative lipoprotein [Deltaproteobacteria bacterium]|nr:putative lipoprotein [Deltaproteobacteria bacterium]